MKPVQKYSYAFPQEFIAAWNRAVVDKNITAEEHKEILSVSQTTPSPDDDRFLRDVKKISVDLEDMAAIQAGAKKAGLNADCFRLNDDTGYMYTRCSGPSAMSDSLGLGGSEKTEIGMAGSGIGYHRATLNGSSGDIGTQGIEVYGAMVFGKVADSRDLKVKSLIDIGNGVVTIHPSLRGRVAISWADDTLIASASAGPVMNLFVSPYLVQVFGGAMGNVYGGNIEGKGGGGFGANWVVGAKLLLLYTELGIPMFGKTETIPRLSIGIGGGF